MKRGRVSFSVFLPAQSATVLVMKRSPDFTPFESQSNRSKTTRDDLEGYPSDMPLRKDLPFTDLSPEEFQNFCVDLANTQFSYSFAVYGRRGESQDGIDVKPLNDSSVCIQCKRYQKFNPSLVKDAFQKFLSGKFFEGPGYFILAVSVKFESKHLLDEWERCAAELKERSKREAILWDYAVLLRLLRDQFDVVKQYFGLATANAFCGVARDPYLKYPLAIDYVHWKRFLEQLLRHVKVTIPQLLETFSDLLNQKGIHFGCKAVFETSSRCEVLDTGQRHTTYEIKFFRVDVSSLNDFSDDCAGLLRTWLSRKGSSSGESWIERIVWLNDELDKNRHHGLFALLAFSRECMETRVIDHRIWENNTHYSLAMDSCLPPFHGSFVEAYQYLVVNGVRMEDDCNEPVLREEYVTIDAFWSRALMERSWHILYSFNSFAMANSINLWAQSNYKGREVTNTGVKMYLVYKQYRTQILGEVNICANIEWKRVE